MKLNRLLANGAPPPSRSLPNQLARNLGTKIVSGELGADSLIPNEKSLCESFGVSRTVVREAIKLLVTKGLIQVRPGDGTRVLPKKSWELLDGDLLGWQYEAGKSSENYDDLIEIRLIFEPSAAEFAARRGSAEAHADIAKSLQSMRDNVGRIHEFAAADAEFHLSILAASGNSYLKALSPLIYAGLLSSVTKSNASTDPGQNSLADPFGQRALPSHELVAKAIFERDTALARDSMLNLLKDATHRIR